jgi:hypothetical protein
MRTPVLQPVFTLSGKYTSPHWSTTKSEVVFAFLQARRDHCTLPYGRDHLALTSCRASCIKVPFLPNSFHRFGGLAAPQWSFCSGKYARCRTVRDQKEEITMSQTRSKRLAQAIALFSAGAAAQSNMSGPPPDASQTGLSPTDLQVTQVDTNGPSGSGETDSHTVP